MTPKCKNCGRKIEEVNGTWLHSFFNSTKCQLVSLEEFHAEPETVEAQ